MELLLFAMFALIVLAGAVGVIVCRNAVHSAIFLLAALFAIAALFAMLWAEFLAVVQLLVYAGGIMVLFLFVIMLVDLEQRGFDMEKGRVGVHPSVPQKWLFGGIAVVTTVMLGILLTGGLPPMAPTPDALKAAVQGPFAADGRVMGNIEWIGQLLFTSYLLPFELASLALLVAMIGATVIARKDS